MKVELEMYIDEDDETVVMAKVSELTKHAKGIGFKLGELEFKNKEGYEKNRKKDKKHHHRGR